MTLCLTHCRLNTLLQQAVIVYESLQSLFRCCILARESTWLSDSAPQQMSLADPVLSSPYSCNVQSYLWEKAGWL